MYNIAATPICRRPKTQNKENKIIKEKKPFKQNEKGKYVEFDEGNEERKMMIFFHISREAILKVIEHGIRI